jgi:IS30 family transposase
MHILNLAVHKYKIEDRRRKVASLLAQSMSETEIVMKLNVDQSTVSRDIKVLKKMSQQFVYDLAKSDLSYCYKQCLDGIKEVKRRGWNIFNSLNNLTIRDKFLA